MLVSLLENSKNPVWLMKYVVLPQNRDDANASGPFWASGTDRNVTVAMDGPPSRVLPRCVMLRDRSTTVTLIPFTATAANSLVPISLLSYLCTQMNREIEKGETYEFNDAMELLSFKTYWFANFVGIMLLGNWGITSSDCYARLRQSTDEEWDRVCLGSFFIKPKHKGKSSHVCTGTFLVTDGQRNRGVGRLMGEAYLEWAPKLGFTYSVFDLVYETNVISCKIWDALKFKRIGRVPGCGFLKGRTEPVDAIIYGRELSASSPDDMIAEERFDRIKYYLTHEKYPDGIGRAEKSRLRSAATHYHLVRADGEEDKLFLRDKEVISDAQKQWEIAHKMHSLGHDGINKTTARINEKYHWLRIKETATQVIKSCLLCNDSTKRAGMSNTTTSATSTALAEPATTNQPVQQQESDQTLNLLRQVSDDMQYLSDVQMMAPDLSQVSQFNQIGQMTPPTTLSTQSSIEQHFDLEQYTQQTVSLDNIPMLQDSYSQQTSQQHLPLEQLGGLSMHQQQHQQQQYPQNPVMGLSDLIAPIDPDIMAQNYQMQNYSPFGEMPVVNQMQMQNTSLPTSASMNDLEQLLEPTFQETYADVSHRSSQ